jgi:SAM-dependent methyltransferase
MSEIGRYLKRGATVLDLGCGPRDQARPIEYLKLDYLGIDYSNPAADLLADAHALPFKPDSFDCVLCYAVLLELHNPFVAISEIKRVLKPGGIFVGTASQGEPFQSSFFHTTAYGVLSLMHAVDGLAIKRLWPSEDTLKSLARVGRYPRAIKTMLRMLNAVHESAPWLAPRRMKWPEKERSLDRLYRASSIGFVIEKSRPAANGTMSSCNSRSR